MTSEITVERRGDRVVLVITDVMGKDTISMTLTAAKSVGMQMVKQASIEENNNGGTDGAPVSGG